jgi:chromosome segregation ATPase
LALFRRRKALYPDGTETTVVGPVAPPVKFSGVFAGVDPAEAAPPADPDARRPRNGRAVPKVQQNAELLSLRNELMEVKARLMAAEQSRAIVESRLAALDATTLSLANQQQALTGGEVVMVSAAVSPDTDLLPRLDELESRVQSLAATATEAAETAQALQALQAIQSAQASAELPPPVPQGTDPDTSARLDDLAARMGAIDTISAQVAQLSARVAAQAELGAQLTQLRERITSLQTDLDARGDTEPQWVDDTPPDTSATDELREQLIALGNRVSTTEALADQLGQLAERVAATDTTARRAGEQVSALEQRLDSVGTELANQLSELGRDIDGLAKHAAQAASGTVDEAVVESLRNGQIKLANEQARYEIAFREDLALLAENLRKPKPSA